MLLQQKYTKIFIISPTERFSHSFGIDEKDIIDTYKPAFIQKLLKAQEQAILKYGFESPKVHSVLLLLDDVVGSIPDNEPTLNQLLTLSRHKKIGVIIITQIARKVLSPTLRQNVDYLFLSKVNENMLKSVYEMIMFDGNFKEFQDFIRKIINSEKFLFILYDNLTPEATNRWYSIKGEECDLNKALPLLDVFYYQKIESQKKDAKNKK